MATTPSVLAKTDRNAEIIRRVLEGQGEVSLQALAAEYNLTRSRVQKIVSTKGISMRAMKRAQKKPVRKVCRICSSTYVKGTYSEHCRVQGHRRLTPSGEKVERNASIVNLYHVEKYNTSEIAEYFEIPQPVVTRILHRAGVHPEGRRRRKGGLVQQELVSA